MARSTQRSFAAIRFFNSIGSIISRVFFGFMDADIFQLFLFCLILRNYKYNSSIWVFHCGRIRSTKFSFASFAAKQKLRELFSHTITARVRQYWLERSFYDTIHQQMKYMRTYGT